MFIEVRGVTNSVVSSELCPAFAAGKAYSPELPAVITSFATTAEDRGDQVSYFTVASTTAGGPTFRVRASKLHSGGTLNLAYPVSISSTLSQLLLLELLVTAAALIGAILLGHWLVRVGLRPLRDVVRTSAGPTASGSTGGPGGGGTGGGGQGQLGFAPTGAGTGPVGNSSGTRPTGLRWWHHSDWGLCWRNGSGRG